MKVNVFAVLKDYYKPSFELEKKADSIKQVREYLLHINPDAAAVLPLCRFAVNDEIVSEDYKLTFHDVISVLPPASGG